MDQVKAFNDLQKRSRLLYILYGVGLVGALVLLITQNLPWALAVFGAVLLFYFLAVRPQMQQYAGQWREYCIRRQAEKLFSAVEYAYKKDADSIPLLKAHLMLPLSSKGKLMIRNAVKGEKAGIRAELMDVTVPHGEGRGMKFAIGCWMGFAFEADAQEPLRAIKGAILPNGAYETFLTEEEGLRRCVMLNDPKQPVRHYSPSGDASLSDEAQRALNTLLKSISGTGVVEISPDGLFVFLPHALLNILPPSMKEPITEATLQLPDLPEIENAYRLALTLRKPGV